MLPFLPRIPLETPDEYVAFVERHLPRLRRDAALVVGSGRHADELYPRVLTDVAARWRWISVASRWLRRPDLADGYLRRAFAKHAKRWQDEQITPVEVEVWQVEALPDPGFAAPPPTGPAPAGPTWTSMALRLAPVLLSSARLEVRPLAEAAIAWWHAYEEQRRRRLVAAGAALTLLLAVLAQAPTRDLDVGYWRSPVTDRDSSLTLQV